ncbi:hypothetical protein [Streptomyces sp. C10-9-1]|uniref:hypothetical protein n=1 Tax=Streptomyces sp. C10-9-1 TaxID=1859285 RepID=UPI003F49BADE
MVAGQQATPSDAAGAERLRIYWTTGPGGAKIAWGAPGDFDRCVKLLNEHMPGKAEGYCNLLHKRATGMYPAQHAAQERGRRGPG